MAATKDGDATDVDLLDAVRRGDREALHELYRRHAARVHLAARVVARRRRLDPDELTVAAFVSLFRSPGEAVRPPRQELVRRVARLAAS